MRTTGAHGRLRALLLCAGVLLPTGAPAFELLLPDHAALVLTTTDTNGRHPIATGPWTGTALPTQDALGLVQEFTWQIPGSVSSTTELLTILRAQIEAQGYAIQFTCFADVCGGFDFRHGLSVGTAPEMHVDLGDFHYLSATSGDRNTEVALMISRGGSTGFVHLALIQPPSEAEDNVIQSTRTPDLESLAIAPGDLIGQLIDSGSAPLDELQFETGASQLNGDRYGSLIALAAFLTENPTERIVLVGHTDAAGSLENNIALSHARAEAVRQYLTDELGVDPYQIEAQGIGFLAPRGPNTTPEGREANRRVEVVRMLPE